MEETISILRDDGITQPKGTFNKMVKLNMEKVMSGDIRQVAMVIKSLSKKNKDKGLSFEDDRLMAYANRIMIGEIMVSEQIGEEKAIQMLDKYIHSSDPIL